MAGEDAPGKAPRQRGLGDDAERPRRRVRRFVDMEVEVKAFALGEGEENLESRLEAGPM